MNIRNVQKFYFTIVILFPFISFPSKHIPQCCIITSSIIYFQIVKIVDFFYFADWVYTLGYFFNHFLILLTSVSHQTCFNLATSENTWVTLSFIFIKICQCWNSFSCSKFWTFSHLLIRNSIRYDEFRWISWWNIIIVVFDESENFFGHVFIININKFFSSLPRKLISYVINFPTTCYWFIRFYFFSKLKSIKSIYSCHMRELRYFLLELL